MKTLVVYSSKYGATKKCAQMIATELQGEVELINLLEKKPKELVKFDQVIIGASIYVGSVSKVVKSFYEENKEFLATKRLGLFLSCMEGSKIEEYIKLNFGEKEIKSLVKQIACGGILDFGKMNFFERTICKMIYKNKEGQNQEAQKITKKTVLDCLDEKAIKEFAKTMNQF
ncbi:flavodoxin [Sporanaerobium hydrogeniformans]|uniref:Flavodoxin n=1 Tax=Sporanaerobium hydrogeniformans TaxID=3072179 RepID=A0AC61D6N3_9FIRM|nr:flavodoxin domain-containing protein [Sporanaerobium hydrogeniformans]PHV69324.1 flavodoxin [Sporanaerobium hydrogeniformans]